MKFGIFYYSKKYLIVFLNPCKTQNMNLLFVLDYTRQQTVWGMRLMSLINVSRLAAGLHFFLYF